MNKINKESIILMIIFILLLIVSALLSLTVYRKYVFVSMIGSIIDILFMYKSLNKKKSNIEEYKELIEYINKTYSALLVSVNQIPEMYNKDIIYVNTFEDLLNVQGEVDKPIFYKSYGREIIYFVIDNNLFCYTIIKLDKSKSSLINEVIKKNIPLPALKRV